MAPKIVVTDQSLALMMAVAKSFTQYTTLSKDLSVCSSLILKDSTELQSCMIRNDFNHVMHLISSWSETKTATYKVKNFYMKSIGLVIVSTNFEEIKKVLKFIFTVAMNEEDGLGLNYLPTPCKEAKKYLKQMIANSQTLTDSKEFTTKEESLSETLEYTDYNIIEKVSTTNVFNKIKSIYNQCLENSSNSASKGTYDNMQFNPKIAKKLLDFCKLLPTWSAILVSFFGYGSTTESSATSESLFNELKNRDFQHKTLPIRLDEFVQEHINFITGSMVLLKAKPEYNKENYNVLEQETENKYHIDTNSDGDIEQIAPSSDDIN